MKRILLTLFCISIVIVSYAQNCLIKQGLTITPDTTICKNKPIPLRFVVNPPKGFSKFADSTRFEWRYPDGTLANATTAEISEIPKEGTYTCTIREGQCTEILKVKVTFRDSILVPIIVDKKIICEGDEVRLYAGLRPKSTLSWSYPVGSDFKCIDSKFCDSITVTPKATFTFNYVSQFTCEVGQNTTVEVRKKPTLSGASVFKFCYNQASNDVVLNPNPTSGIIYTWTSKGNELWKKDTTTPSLIIEKPYKSAVYTVTMRNDACERKADVSIIVANNITIENLTKDTTICPGAAVKLNFLSNYASPTLRHTWEGAGVDGINRDIIVNTDITKTYTLKLFYPEALNGEQCTTSFPVNINVRPSSLIKIEPSESSAAGVYPLGKSIDLDVKPAENVDYQWSFKGKVDEKVKTSRNSVVLSDTGTFVVKYRDQYGCMPMAMFRIGELRRPKVVFPTIFVPEETNDNGVFRPFYPLLSSITNNGTILIEEMNIFNRWGQKVYQLQLTETQTGIPIDDRFQGWNGHCDNDINKEILPADVYIVRYKIRYGDGTFDWETTDVTLVR